jgi:hypothetical protein
MCSFTRTIDDKHLTFSLAYCCRGPDHCWPKCGLLFLPKLGHVLAPSCSSCVKHTASCRADKNVRSPDITPLDFFFRGYIKDAVYVPPLAITLPELAGRIRHAVATVTLDLLNNVWTEIAYRYDICRPTSRCPHWTYVKCRPQLII